MHAYDRAAGEAANPGGADVPSAAKHSTVDWTGYLLAPSGDQTVSWRLGVFDKTRKFLLVAHLALVIKLLPDWGTACLFPYF